MNLEKPHVVLYFESLEDKQEFMNQLSDGWGESYVSLDWGWGKYSTPEETGKAFDRCTEFFVEVFNDNNDDFVVPGEDE